jgi:hypothetical protein
MLIVAIARGPIAVCDILLPKLRKIVLILLAHRELVGGKA